MTRFYISYAWRSLLRGGQRSLLAVACVAFGVLSLVALQELAAIIGDAFLVSPRQVRGGDLVLTRPSGLDEPGHLEDLERMGARGAPLATVQARLMKPSGSGRVSIVGEALGIDPQRYPLYGTLSLRHPAGATVAGQLERTGSAIITQDLADQDGLRLGDAIALVGDPKAPPLRLEVTGIADETPARTGRAVFFSLETVRTAGLGGATHLVVRHPDPPAILAQLESAGYEVTEVPLEARSQESDLFRFMLAATGILGLLIGGIGAANTMQVLLARRSEEIATLKTLGYRQGHLLWLFGIEAVLLGLAGSAVGVALGLLVARFFMNLLDGLVPYLLVYRVPPAIIPGGLLVGVVTTLIFGLVAIVRASEVRPSSLLRGMTEPLRGRRRAATFGLYAVLFGLFGLLSSSVLESALRGFGVVAGGLFLLGLLALVLGAVLLGVVRIPLPGLPLLSMARRNLRHQPIRSIFGLVALFVGTYAIGFASITLLNASERFRERQVELAGVNLRIYATREDEPALLAKVDELGVTAVYTEFSTEARVFDSADSLLHGLDTVIGRRRPDLLEQMALTDSLEVPYEEAAYVIQAQALRHGLAVGDTLRLSTGHGEVRVRLAGIFRSRLGAFALSGPPSGLVVGEPVARQLSGSNSPIQMSLAADSDRLAEIAEAIGVAVPQSVVIGKDTVFGIINAAFRGVFWFAVSVATLALLAGTVLIANAVGLSMVERKRELGILKAIGYGSRQVLGVVILENGLLGLISGVLGVAALLVTVVVVNLMQPAAELSLSVGQAMLLTTVAVVLAVVSAVLVAWRPTHVRPLEVLRGE